MFRKKTPKRNAAGQFVAGSGKSKVKVRTKVTVVSHANRYIKFVEKGLAAALEKVGEEMVIEIQDSMIHPKGPPAPAGDPPAVQTGNLRSSIDQEVVYRAGGGKDQIVLKVGSQKVPYAIIHEKGGTFAIKRKKMRSQHALKYGKGILKDTVTFPKRPYIQPVFDDWLKNDKVMPVIREFYDKMLKPAKTKSALLTAYRKAQKHSRATKNRGLI